MTVKDPTYTKKVALTARAIEKMKPETFLVDIEPYRVCRRVNILRDYPDDKIKIYP